MYREAAICSSCQARFGKDTDGSISGISAALSRCLLKPFFVKQAKERDRRLCLCRKHVETKIVFTTCMKFRQGITKEADNNNEYPVLRNVTEAAEKTENH